MGLQPVADRRLLVQHERDESHTEQSEPDETQRRRTHDEEQRDPAGADHSAVRQQLSDAHWRVIIWRTPFGHGSPVQYHHRSRLEPGRLSDGGPKVRGLRRSRAVCCVACLGGRHDRRDRAAAQRVRGLPVPRLHVDGARRSTARGARWIDPSDAAPADRRRPRRRRLPGVDPHLRAGRLAPGRRAAARLQPVSRGGTHHRHAGRPQRDLRTALRRVLGGHHTSARIAESRGADGRRRRPERTGDVRLVRPRPRARPSRSPARCSTAALHRSRSRRPSRRASTAWSSRARSSRCLAPIRWAARSPRPSRARVDRPSDARRCVRASAATAPSQCSASSSFDSPAPPGGTLAVSGQPGWFGARSITLPQASLRPDGFDVSIPGGDTGNYDFGLRFFDPETISSLAPTSPLRCLALGSAVSCSGGAPASRLSASAGGLFVVPGDSVDVTATESDGDSASVSATAGGLSGSLDDGSLIVRGAPRALVLAALRSPRAAPLAPFVATHSDRTDASGTATLEDSFAVHIQNGAVATLSGPATGPTAQTFTWDLVASVGASGVVSGTTYANARVAVDHEQGGRTEHLETTANAAGSVLRDALRSTPGRRRADRRRRAGDPSADHHVHGGRRAHPEHHRGERRAVRTRHRHAHGGGHGPRQRAVERSLGGRRCRRCSRPPRPSRTRSTRPAGPTARTASRRPAARRRAPRTTCT